jgi:hypothetical protein
MIHYYRYNEIDKSAWDNCIENSPNGLVYAYSWYLDIVCPGWEALVEGDYKTVMPLPVKTKWRIKYVYQPNFVQQLGVFGPKTDHDIVESFLNAVPESIVYLNFNLNSSNNLNQDLWNLTSRNNFILSLNREYSEIFKNYSENQQRNIKKAVGCKMKIEATPDLNTYMELVRKYNPYKMPENEYLVMYELLKELQHRNKGIILSAKGENDTILASVFIIEALNRSMYIFPLSTDAGRKMSAMALIVDSYINDNCLSSGIFDFEGSNVEKIARFFKGFGAINQSYLEIKINRLPFWIKWIKN